MNELHLPPAPPLPPDVRERALRTVLTGIDARPRRRSRLLAVAAALVAVLTVATAVTLSGLGGADGPGLDRLRAGQPITSGDPRSDPALIRCADAVHMAGRAAEYPPTDQWRATEVLLFSPAGGDIAIAINDMFACFVGGSDVLLTPARGTPAGAATLAWLTPANLAVLNPERQPIALVPSAAAAVHPGSPTAAVQLLNFGVANARTANYRITVGDSYNGPIPEPAPVAVVVSDRPPISRAPTPGVWEQLDACVTNEMPGAAVVARHGPNGPFAVLATRGDSYAGFCMEGPAGPVFAGGDVPSTAERAESSVVATARAAASDAVGVLVAVPPTVARAEITTDPERAPNETSAQCALRDGLAVCTLNAPGDVHVITYDAGGVPTAVPMR